MSTETTITVNRYRKAMRIVGAFHSMLVTSEKLDERAWTVALKIASIKSASDETRALAVEILRTEEATAYMREHA